MTVRMVHPETGGTYNAQPSQVPLLELSGWQTIEGEDLTDVEPLPPELQLFEGQQQVRLHHPETGADITVAESAVPFHRERGWLLADEEAEPESEEPKPARRRRGQQSEPATAAEQTSEESE